MRKRFDEWQIARARAAFTSVSGHQSELSGFDGMVEEMRWGLANLSDEERFEADQRVLQGAFLGGLAAASLKALWSLSPRLMTRVMATASPVSLAWLVGPMQSQGTENFIPSCRFRERGGPELCERVCRRPSEAFCAARTVPVRLNPDPDSMACRWVWGDSQ